MTKGPLQYTAGRATRPRVPARGARTPRAPSSRLEDVAVLVVDDDEPSVKLMRFVLEEDGATVRVARSGEDALADIAREIPQVAVIDLILPHMSGLLLADRLKADAATRGIVLVAVTAFNGSATERIAREAGFVDYVRKPIDPLTFSSLVAATLRK